MAESDNLIDFNVIESHKENIQALPSGRSAKALAQLYSPPLLGANPSPSATEDANTGRRKDFEIELRNIDEADDPLDVYDRYVKWTLDAYPSAQATPQSQLLPLLERATKAFQLSSHYNNDPRYLRLWLHYIRLFSDSPREVFVFLARHGIGETLALYYEEFAAWLENAGRWTQAEEIFQMGLEKEARPAERLLRKFGEFERRNQARASEEPEPTSPALPLARPALAAKIDPFASASPSGGQPQSSGSTVVKKSKSSKIAIFSDSDESSRPNSGSGAKGWDNIGSLADRKKENTMEAKPWAGERLKGGKTNGGMQKMMVFKDESSASSHNASSILPRHLSRLLSGNAHQEQCLLSAKTGRMECVFVDLESIYPKGAESGVEYCFEELRARRRGLLDRDWERPACRRQREESAEKIEEQNTTEAAMRQTEPEVDVEESKSPPRTKQRGFKIFEDVVHEPIAEPTSRTDHEVLVETFSQNLALNDENDENAAPHEAPPPRKGEDLAKKIRRDERTNRTRKIQVLDVKHISSQTKTIQINLESPTGPKLRRKKSSDRPEPTMTINTREAMDEVYGMFNQPLESQGEQTDGEDGDSDDEDYTTGDESTGTGKLSGAASEYGDETRNELFVGSANQNAGDRTEVSSWSDFTSSKHVPKDANEPDSGPGSSQSGTWDVNEEESLSQRTAIPNDCRDEPGIVEEDGFPQTKYVPVPPEGYQPPMGQYRDLAVVANNRLPFMTPIVEQTESSLGVRTTKTTSAKDKDYFSAKTPSRKTTGLLPTPQSEGADDHHPLSSSPFQEALADREEAKRKVLHPIRTKSTKGTISLGHGSAKAQIAAKTTVPEEPAAQKGGPIITDLRCNPTDAEIRQTILTQMKPPMSSFEGYHEHTDVVSGRSAEIRKYVRTIAKANRSSAHLDRTASTLALPPTLSFSGTDTTYTVKKELGAGTFAPVYLVENSAALAAADEEAEDGADGQPIAPLSRVGKSTHRRPLEAIKMEEPPSIWEFYMLRQCHRRLGVSRAAESIVRAHEMHLFRDECFLVEEFRDQGTLLDLVNLARAENSGNGGGMDETLAMWLTVELLRTVEALHSKQLIHGDLKADNVLVRFADPGPETDWAWTYFPSGAHGWAAKGVLLIDLGRGIDMRAFPPDVAFVADWETSAADCPEMREGRPWTYQIDYFGLAGIVHSMLFGKYMETIDEKIGTGVGIVGGMKTYRIRESLKRYWQTDLWTQMFAVLLNPLAHVREEAGGRLPLLGGLRACRERMEGWLEENCERGGGLKGMVSRMEGLIRERRRKSGRLGNA